MATTADSTLVQAAFKEGQTGAMADVPNLKPLYEHTTKIAKEFTATITGIVDQINLERDQEQAAIEKRMEPLKVLANDIYDATYNGGEAMPDIYVDKITEKVEELKASFEKVNTEGEGDTKANERERRRITGELTRVKNEVVKFRSDYMLATQDPESWNLNSVKGDNIDALRSVLDWKSINENPNVTAEWVDGRLTTVTKGYSAGTRRVKGPEDSVLGMTREEYQIGEARSFNSSDVVKALRKKNPANDAMVSSDQAPWSTLGDTDGKNGAPRHFENQHAIDAETANFESLVKTDEDYYDIASRRMEGINAASFEQALGGNADIPISILANMFIDDNGNPITGLAEQIAALDISGDGIINYKDEPKDSEALAKFKENIKLTRETILENKDIGLPIMADYYTKLKVTAYNENYDKQEKARNKRNATSKTKGLTLSYGYRTWGQMQTQYDQISSGNDIIKGGDGTIWNKQENGTYKLSGGEDVRTPNQLKDHFELNHLDSYKEPEGGYTSMSDDGDGEIPELAVPGAENFAAYLSFAEKNAIVSNWENEHSDFKFEKSGIGNTIVTVTAPNGKKHVAKLMRFLGDRNKQAKAFNKFIADNQE
jgi:hypothetical protein